MSQAVTPKESSRPETGEYAESFHKYISLVSGNDPVSSLEAQRLQMLQLLSGRSERDGNFRYGPDKWTVKQVVGHISDSERVFTYRALCIARGEKKSLPGFEENDYVQNAVFPERTLSDLAEEFSVVRIASIALLRSLNAEAWLRRGLANNREITVRALAYIIPGHELHHRKLLEERYFPAIPRA